MRVPDQALRHDASSSPESGTDSSARAGWRTIRERAMPSHPHDEHQRLVSHLRTGRSTAQRIGSVSSDEHRGQVRPAGRKAINRAIGASRVAIQSTVMIHNIRSSMGRVQCPNRVWNIRAAGAASR